MRKKSKNKTAKPTQDGNAQNRPPRLPERSEGSQLPPPQLYLVKQESPQLTPTRPQCKLVQSLNTYVDQLQAQIDYLLRT